MGSKSYCHFERRRCARFASASAKSRNLLFADTQIDVGARAKHRRLVDTFSSVSTPSKQQVPRLRKIVRFANNPASLGMTGLRERRKQGVRGAA